MNRAIPTLTTAEPAQAGPDHRPVAVVDRVEEPHDGVGGAHQDPASVERKCSSTASSAKPTAAGRS